MAPSIPIDDMPNRSAPYSPQMLCTSSQKCEDMSVTWATPAWTGSTV